MISQHSPCTTEYAIEADLAHMPHTHEDHVKYKLFCLYSILCDLTIIIMCTLS
jgi:hypothetical protein